MNQNPWFLPKGSIRGLLAGALVGATIFQAIQTGAVPEALSTLTALAVTFYFKTREA